MSRKVFLLALAALACGDGADEVTGLRFDGPQPSAVCSAQDVCDTMDGSWDGVFGKDAPGGRDTLSLHLSIIDEKSSFYTGVMGGGGDLSIDFSNPGVSIALSGSRTESDFALTLAFDTLATLTFEGIWENDRLIGLLNGSIRRNVWDTLSVEVVFDGFQVMLDRTFVTLN